jgi:hypothetical protein
MVRFSYSDKNTKDEERRESLSAKDNPYTTCGVERQVLNHTLVSRGSSLAMPQHLEHRWDVYYLYSIGPVAEPRHNKAIVN